MLERLDVKSLYTNIPKEEGIEAVRSRCGVYKCQIIIRSNYKFSLVNINPE